MVWKTPCLSNVETSNSLFQSFLKSAYQTNLLITNIYKKTNRFFFVLMDLIKVLLVSQVSQKLRILLVQATLLINVIVKISFNLYLIDDIYLLTQPILKIHVHHLSVGPNQYPCFHPVFPYHYLSHNF